MCICGGGVWAQKFAAKPKMIDLILIGLEKCKVSAILQPERETYNRERESEREYVWIFVSEM